jgi:hypothetical protein
VPGAAGATDALVLLLAVRLLGGAVEFMLPGVLVELLGRVELLMAWPLLPAAMVRLLAAGPVGWLAGSTMVATPGVSLGPTLPALAVLVVDRRRSRRVAANVVDLSAMDGCLLLLVGDERAAGCRTRLSVWCVGSAAAVAVQGCYRWS